MANMVGPVEDAAWRDAARDEILQLIDDMLYTEKTHLASAERLHRAHRTWGLVATVLSTAAAATIVAQWSASVAGILALGAAIVSGVLTFMKPETAAEQHLSAGRQLGALRVRTRQLLQLDLTRLPVKELRKAITEVEREKATIDAAAPGTTAKNFTVARNRIQSGIFDRDVSPHAISTEHRQADIDTDETS